MPAAATTSFHLRLSELPCEVVAVAWLDIHLRLIEFREIFSVTVTGATVHVREAVMAALACNAVYAIVALNHPSVDATPSPDGAAVTRKLPAALALVAVSLIDPIVVAAGAEPVSIATRGLLSDAEPTTLTRHRRGKRTTA